MALPLLAPPLMCSRRQRCVSANYVASRPELLLISLNGTVNFGHEGVKFQIEQLMCLWYRSQGWLPPGIWGRLFHGIKTKREVDTNLYLGLSDTAEQLVDWLAFGSPTNIPPMSIALIALIDVCRSLSFHISPKGKGRGFGHHSDDHGINRVTSNQGRGKNCVHHLEKWW